MLPGVGDLDRPAVVHGLKVEDDDEVRQEEEDDTIANPVAHRPGLSQQDDRVTACCVLVCI